MKFGRWITLSIFTFLVVSQTNAEDRQIVVSDCESKPRVVESLGDVENVGLRANVVDTHSAKVTVTLTNVASGEPLVQETEKGSVQFENLKAGQWTMCLEPVSAEASDIEIIKPDGETFSTVSAVGASAAGVLAIALGSNSSSGSSEGGSDVSNTSSIIESTQTAGEPLEAVAAKKPTESAEDSVCFIGEDLDVTPISVFK